MFPCDDAGYWLGLDGANVIRGNAASWVAWRFVHGPGVDDPLVGLYQSVAGTFAKYYYVTDGRGRLLAFTAADGTDRRAFPEYTNGGNQAGAITGSHGFANGRAESDQAPELSYYAAPPAHHRCARPPPTTIF